MIPKNAEFGKRLKELRDLRGLTQTELALEVGCTSAAVSRWERGDGMSTKKSLDSLAKALKTTPDYLLNGVPQSHEAQEPDVEVDVEDELIPAENEYETVIEAARAAFAKRNNVPLEQVRIGFSF